MRVSSMENSPQAHSDPQAAMDTSGTMPRLSGVHDAVNTAVDSSEGTLDPQLVSKITEQVVSALKKEMLTATTTAPPSHPHHSNSVPPSLDHGRGTSNDSQHFYERRSHSLYDDQFSKAYQHGPIPVRQSVPSPPTSPDSAHMPARYTPPSPTRDASPTRYTNSPEPMSSDAGRNSRRGSRSSASGKENVRSSSRMRPVRVPSAVEETSLEKAWKPLFQNGKPTARMGQFMRGLAKHLIDDYAPKHSIVVTPGKLSDFFSTTEVIGESYAWRNIFGGKITNSAISKMFSTLGCQHHLIPFGEMDTPTIPALTPKGFETFMVMLILAHPDQEFRRLSKALREMPISNADEPSERFPKELPRRLLPASGDTMQIGRLASMMSLDCMAALGLGSSFPAPPPGPYDGAERGRAPTASQPARTSRRYSPSMPEPEHTSEPAAIERERKPYSAREGGGKIYDTGRASSNDPKPRSRTRTHRSGSNASNGAPPMSYPAGGSYPGPRPVDGPPRQHRMSMGGPPPSFRPPVNPYTRSDGTNISDIPSGYYTTNMPYYPDEYDDYRTPRRPSPRRY